MLAMVPNSHKTIVLLFLSVLTSDLSCAPVFAADQEAVDQQFGQFSGQSFFRDSFFSEQIRQSSSMDDLAELERKRRDERAEKKELRRERDANEEKDKLERDQRNRQMFDRSEDGSNTSLSSGSANNNYSTPILDNDFTFNFEKQVLQSDLFSDHRSKSSPDYSPDLGLDFKPADFDWLEVMRSNSGLFPRAREVDDHKFDRDKDTDSWEKRRERAKLPGRIIEVTGDWVPDKLDPTSNGGFTIAPDNGSPVPYKLNGHVDIQRGRPWNDND